MAELKTRVEDTDPRDYLNTLEEKRRNEGFILLELMSEVSGEPARMWGPTMIGFGEYHYKYPTGHEGDTFRVGFSPRKAKLSLYVLTGLPESEALLEDFGKHTRGKACLYANKLADIDLEVLRKLVKHAYDHADHLDSRFGKY
ncbi:MAG: DUF1801 domain-containing protein [Microbacteriaceae bacterium]